MISRVLVIVGLIVLTADCTDLTITGWSLAAALLIWTGWALNHHYGLIADPETSARLSRVDTELRIREGKQP